MSNNGPIFFWHPHGADYPWLSQHHICEFTDENGQKFTSTEQYMMYHKALHFNDIPMSQEILNTTNPPKIKSLGRQVKNFNSQKWDQVKFQIVTQGNVLKFSRGGKELREQLEKTGIGW
ncbi:af455dfe-2c2a-48d5-bb6a-995450627cbd-CDS [Sclerotinia trifoliorum]|uniref:Af455dfe-2c2a-48d5-bb6a-995450627cbd-CDS n=1 Tax=Sclerotinia trifoliorum TaxID=28548 RepID=A0A8H2VPZ8_9HELO|nr:af455dfe-2c2a-48d5-bb6a-995450627cbd-CDS [Sclerotinia trifoliorum]